MLWASSCFNDWPVVEGEKTVFGYMLSHTILQQTSSILLNKFDQTMGFNTYLIFREKQLLKHFIRDINNTCKPN